MAIFDCFKFWFKEKRQFSSKKTLQFETQSLGSELASFLHLKWVLRTLFVKLRLYFPPCQITRHVSKRHKKGNICALCFEPQVCLARDFLINGWCIGTFFLKLYKGWNNFNAFLLHVGKINKNHDRK